MSRAKLPTATVDDVLSWRPCVTWRDRARIERLFARYGRTAVNALDMLELTESECGESDRVWAACHLLPTDIVFDFPTKGCGDPTCCIPGHGRSVWASASPGEGLDLGTPEQLEAALRLYCGEVP